MVGNRLDKELVIESGREVSQWVVAGGDLVTKVLDRADGDASFTTSITTRVWWTASPRSSSGL